MGRKTIIFAIIAFIVVVGCIIGGAYFLIKAPKTFYIHCYPELQHSFCKVEDPIYWDAQYNIKAGYYCSTLDYTLRECADKLTAHADCKLQEEHNFDYINVDCGEEFYECSSLCSVAEVFREDNSSTYKPSMYQCEQQCRINFCEIHKGWSPNIYRKFRCTNVEGENLLEKTQKEIEEKIYNKKAIDYGR